MRFRFEVKCLGTETHVCYQHAVFKNYGLALSVSPDRNSVSCALVFGDIDSRSKLEIVNDFSAPVDVIVWAFNIIQSIQNTVNGKSVDVENLSANKISYNGDQK